MRQRVWKIFILGITLGVMNTVPLWGEIAELPLAQTETGPTVSLSWDHNQFHFELPALTQGQVSSDRFVGDITLCFFWADWNKTGSDQLQGLNEFWLKYKLLGVQLVGFSVDPDMEHAAKLCEKNDWHFPCARIYSRQLIASAAPVKGLPTLLILAPGGIVYRKYEGIISPEVLEGDVLNLMRQKNQTPAF
jgi:peroxiredoxin